jgi:Holliday junction DNA helicase RuvB
VITYLTRLIGGAKALGKPCPPLLLAAPSGAGKTTFARAIATAYGSTLHELHAGEATRTLDICGHLYDLAYGDIFFIDEAHSLNRDAQQVLYMALDRAKVPRLHKGRVDQSHLGSIAEFTLIMATNEPGGITRGLRTRLARIEFDRYTLPELKAIAERIAALEGLELTPQAARRLAEVAQHLPRSIVRRLEHLRFFWPQVQRFTQEHVAELLAHEGIDARGLSPHQRLYLRTLAASPRRLCSLERLSAKLGCDMATLRQEIEPYLIDQGLVDPLSGRGRTLTDAGCVEVAGMDAALAAPEG